ncbi:hypothetical protein C6P46_003928 [Rhodotorula mucilaginosa]|uniref:Uncharacterized protein n=1 Tax=Rhodotorula mucilaginosa TaxID=5537 RepID=A0A9P6W0V8_RHOMI|nr:hypothetical protein C6P46_003928 [Rhodotorula mucilaginosa]
MSDTSGTPAGDKTDTVIADNQSQTGSTEVERRRVTIHDLPPEIVLAIVEQVDLISAQDRLWGGTGQHNHGGAGAAGVAGGGGGGGGGGNANGAEGDQAGGGGGALNAAELFADMFNNLLGNMPQAGGAAAAGAPVPPPTTAAANNGQQDDDDDDEMPPLEPLPNAGRAANNTTTTAPATAGTAPRAQQQQQQGNDDDDEMPPLEPINAPPAAAATAPRPAPTSAAAPAPAAAATGNARAGSSFLSAFSNPLAAFAGLTGANRSSNNNNSAASSSTPARSPTAAPAPAAAAAAAARGGGDDDDDDMPPLEPINPATTRPPSTTFTPAAAAAAPPRATPSTSTARATRNVVDDDDEMPPLEPIEGATSSTSRGSAPRPAATPSAARPAASTSNDDDDDMPPLEPINPSSTSSSSAAGPSSSSGTKKAKKSGEETEDDMPELEPIASNRVADRSRLTSPSSPSGTGAAAPAATTTTTTTTTTITTGGANDDDDDDLPPLEPLDDVLPSTTRASDPAPTAATTAARADDDEEMPPLEPLDDETPATAAPARVAGAGDGGPEDSGNDDDDDDEDDDDEDEDEWESDEDDDDEEEDDEDEDDFVLNDDDEDRIFVDGLPSDPVVPLALINRPFLHAARKVLYRHVAVPSPYVAVLIHETLSRPDPAGFVDGDKVLLPTKEYDGGKIKLVRNVLCDMVHSLTFTLETDCSLGRGGGRVYIDLIRMCATNLESLTLRPMFLASATKPLLEALAELKRLKQVDINSSTDPKRPFIVTTARVYKLLQQSWLDLERLVITDLKPAEDGPEDEVEEMWEISDAAADAEYDRLKVEKKAGEGDDDDESENKDEGDKVDKDTIVSKRPRGLKELQLLGFNVTGTELELILQDSKQTLQALTLQRPNYLFKRAGLASTLLTFGHNLTSLDLYLPQTWDPVPKLLPGQSRPPFPVRPKDHKVGEPTSDYVDRVGKYTYLLDAVMPCLPNLTRLRFDGPHASAHVFAWFPEKLKTVSFSNCPTISPSTLVKVLNKTLTRAKQVTKKDGSVGTKSFQTKAARGMKCLTVTNDDLNWSESEIGALQDTLDERDCCLHLTSDGVHGGFFPIFGGIGLGGLFGGAQRPGGAAAAQPAARRQRNNAAAL